MNTNNEAKVLACVDGSYFSAAVCDYAAWIAKQVKVPVKLLHTIEHADTPAVSDLSGAIGLGASEDLLNQLTQLEQQRSQLLIEKGNIMLKAAKKRVQDLGIESVEIRQRHGSLSESLIDLEPQIRVLVVGIRGESHNHEDSAIGAQLETTIRSLHRPILVVNKEFTEPQKVMLAYDGSDCCEKALNMVASSPAFKNIPCHLVHVGDESKQAMLNAAAAKLSDVGISVATQLLSGNTEDALAEYQNEQHIDLTLMGAFSHNRFRDFLVGSFTAKMLHKTQRPLLLLR